MPFARETVMSCNFALDVGENPVEPGACGTGRSYIVLSSFHLFHRLSLSFIVFSCLGLTSVVSYRPSLICLLLSFLPSSFVFDCSYIVLCNVAFFCPLLSSTVAPVCPRRALCAGRKNYVALGYCYYGNFCC